MENSSPEREWEVCSLRSIALIWLNLFCVLFSFLCVLLNILKMESIGFQWMELIYVCLPHIQMQSWNEIPDRKGILSAFLPRFLTFVYFGTSVLEMYLLVALGSPSMHSQECRCTPKLVLGIRKGDLIVTLKWSHPFPEWDQDSGDFFAHLLYRYAEMNVTICCSYTVTECDTQMLLSQCNKGELYNTLGEECYSLRGNLKMSIK